MQFYHIKRNFLLFFSYIFKKKYIGNCELYIFIMTISECHSEAPFGSCRMGRGIFIIMIKKDSSPRLKRGFGMTNY
jgi:hypothetical protein